MATVHDREPVVAERYRGLARSYDVVSAMADPFRRRAVELLAVGHGDVVVDVGCGTGLCFGAIEGRIGPAGALIGIDASPEMLDGARERVERAGWDNVTLIESFAEEAEIPLEADAALLCLVHDILQSDEALKNLCYRVVPGGRVAVLGAKWASPYLVMSNVMTWALHRPYVASFEGFDRPWRLLEQHAAELHVEPILLGTAFLAWGSIP